ncbi:uncharacterized protein A1O9_11739 [Exophiala aquamarina CBS 119918]|uniref:Xylanolytic transcriptional activator regulatory domain-containing protein n=1 Tax=Exophiala aquamarina CBS 119918 TaxID=1182545 RepID=A0A072NYK9_9EURO|nr:uncharacterized protein A1O9_11739 [Exophiala aquamarina CBS 119918]KEF52113.1 hypothetical protein A1O9_11739 [Exophiala aquamarina CBS 119918]
MQTPFLKPTERGKRPVGPSVTKIQLERETSSPSTQQFNNTSGSQLEMNNGSTSSAEEYTNAQDEQEFNWQAAAAQSLPSPQPLDVSIGLYNNGLSWAEADRSAHGQNLPPFVRPMPSWLTTEDIEYLWCKGALQVPEPELRDNLVQCYILYIHPCFPLIDLEAFQASLQDPSRHESISLLLFQAIMFASSPWADIKLVRKLGFWTRKAMRSAFYLKTILLYNLNYERDNFVNVQALLLLSSWWDGPNGYKDGYYWCGLAISTARSIGLNRDVHRQNVPPSVRKLRRKVWWTCLTRDTLTTLAGNRAPRVKDSDFNVPELTLGDFHIHEPNSVTTPWDVSRDANSQTQLAIICIAMSKICRIISHILELAFRENSLGQTGILYPKEEFDTSANDLDPQAPRKDFKLHACEEELRCWRDEVPEEALHCSPSPIVALPHEQAPFLHRAIVSCLYFMAKFSLNRPSVFFDKTALTPKSGQPQPSQRRMRSAAGSINKIMIDLCKVDLMRSLPSTAICCIVASSMCHIADIKSVEEDIRQYGVRRIEECKQALLELADSHLSAKWAANFLTFAASHFTRTSHRTMIGLEAQGGPLKQIQPLLGNSFPPDPSFGVDSVAPNAEMTTISMTELEPWQPTDINALETDSSADNTLMLLQDGDPSFPSFPNMQLGLERYFESFNEMSYGRDFGSLL